MNIFDTRDVNMLYSEELTIPQPPRTSGPSSDSGTLHSAVLYINSWSNEATEDFPCVPVTATTFKFLEGSW